MDINQKLLSDITIYNKYAKHISHLNRRENWNELVTRNKEMHLKKFPKLTEEIEFAYKFVYDKKVLPSMRSMQFAGKPIEINPTRIYNCAYLPVDHWESFSEIMFLLLGGTGVGFSVQKHHIEKLPEIRKPSKNKKKRYLIGDSIEGWADSIKMLIKSYYFNGGKIDFDFSDIRPKGTRLITSGGKAPGPQPLKECLIKIEGILDSHEEGEKLSPIEIHDIVCHIADAVLAGGIRRAALISLFSADDLEMITCKSGNWYELSPHRARANNSAVLVRSRITKEFFLKLWERIHLSNSGEPGIFFTNDKDWGTNPCCEISLRPFQMCNLCEINVSDIESQEDLNSRVIAATLIGTIQASYTNFHYLRDIWKKTCEKDALLGIGMTGIASNKLETLNLEEAVLIAKKENERLAKQININKAARITCVKPSGTTSCVLGTSSGIHAWHSAYYIRRIRVLKNDPLYTYISIYHPEILEDEFFRPHDTAVISLPQKAPTGAILRNESAISLLERVKKYNQLWIRSGHNTGMNTHNISATISIKDNEWTEVGEWMWNNKDCYNGLSVLPYDGHTYVQAPFEEISKEKYKEMIAHIHDLDLSKIVEMDDITNLSGELACSGGSCEIV